MKNGFLHGAGQCRGCYQHRPFALLDAKGQGFCCIEHAEWVGTAPWDFAAARPTLKLPLLTEEQCNEEALRRVTGGLRLVGGGR